ncbi:MAG TPA: PAS domain S-box protein [Bacteroidales bacterium]|nr:PAS domain S-box protein [Bacteroidales bacterium]
MMARILPLVSRFAWMPIPLLLIVIVLGKMLAFGYVNENTLLLLILNLVFNSSASLLIIYLTGRSFLISGRISLVLFSCAALIWGFAGSLSAIFGKADPNTTVTIYNLSVLLSAILYLAGAFLWSRQKLSIKFPGIWLTVSFFITFALIALIVLLAISGRTPLFFIEDKGGTPLRYYVLILCTVLFVSTAIRLKVSEKSLGLKSLYWYSIALGLLSIGFLAIMLQLRMGDFLNWTGRTAQFLGGIYMTIAAITLVKETNVWELSIEFELNRKRQLAETALRKSEGRYQQIVELAGEGIIITDENFLITEWNKAAEMLYGWTAREVLGKNSHEILRSGIGESELLHLLEDPSGIIEYETITHKKDGTPLDVVVRLSVIRNEDGNVTGYISINHDITERKRAEQELRKNEERFRIMGEKLKYAKDELEWSQKRLNIALENANIGLWEWKFAENELLWDEKTERMFGFTPGTFGKSLDAFEELVQDEDLQRVRTAYRNCIENGTPFEVVYRIKSAENSKYISAKAFISKDEDERPHSMVGVCFDITAFREDTDKAIIKLNQELTRSNRDLENFAYVASHDLQEPLRMVTSFTQLLQMRYDDKLDMEGREYINYAVDGSKRMYELLNALLSYSRVGTRGKEFTWTDMNIVLSKVKANLIIKLQEMQAIVEWDELPGIMADENQMVQLMQNLVENGIKFSKNKPEITISSRDEETCHVFSVKDKGIGIEPQYYERIFRIFQRLHGKNEYGGMGIGLSICQRIVERHGGKIWVESVPEKGSTFFFSIPKAV